MTFVIAALAVWRLSVLLAEEEGPFGVVGTLRDKIDPIQLTWLGRGVRCVWCVSFWVGWPVALYLYVIGAVVGAWVPLVALGLSTGAIIVDRVVKR